MSNPYSSPVTHDSTASDSPPIEPRASASSASFTIAVALTALTTAILALALSTGRQEWCFVPAAGASVAGFSFLHATRSASAKRARARSGMIIALVVQAIATFTFVPP